MHVLSLLLFVGYLPAQVIEKSHVDSSIIGQTGAISVDEIKQSDNTAKMVTENYSTAKADTVGQKINNIEVKNIEERLFWIYSG
jgi:hypothetical protein